MHAQLLSRVQLFATPWTVALQVPLSLEFSWQEYWSGLPFPTPGDLVGLFCFFCFNFYWSVVDNVVLASRVQQSESVIHVHMYIYICIRTHIFLLKSFCLIVHYRALSRVPYAIQHILITYLFYVW